MKLYRIVPDSTCESDISTIFLDSPQESLFYELGYVSFNGKRSICEDNTFDDLPNEGKFFYLNVDSIIAFLAMNHLITERVKVLEYNFDIDTVFNYIGYGMYSVGRPRIESFIPKSSLQGPVLNASQITKEEKVKTLINEVRKTLKYQMFDYLISDLKKIGYQDIDEVPDKDLVSGLKYTYFYHIFLESKVDLVKTSAITGKTIILNNQTYMSDKLQDENIERINNSGLFEDEDKSDCYEEIRRLIIEKRIEEAKDIARIHKL